MGDTYTIQPIEMSDREMSVKLGLWLPTAEFSMNFPSDLFPPLLQTLEKLEFKTMTPVQEATLPLFMRNKDVIVEAVTGSGKTLGFLLPTLQILIKSKLENELRMHSIGALIIAPTRELAEQIFKILNLFLDSVNSFYFKKFKHSLSTQLLIGGSNHEKDLKEFQEKGGNILVGTPGRMHELLTTYSYLYNTKDLEVLVLDEADRLLDMGFEFSLNAILKFLPKQRRTGLFSATMSDSLNEWSRVGLRNPVKITKVEFNQLENENQRIPSGLKIYYRLSEPSQKWFNLSQVLQMNPNQKFILYVATCAVVDYYYKLLTNWKRFNGFNWFSLHGKMDPKRRQAVYSKFASSGPKSILICTDIAARGLDFPDIDYVIQYDPPQDPKSFSHRCGRTARIGKEGSALVFLDPKEDTFIEFLKIRKVPMEELALPMDEFVEDFCKEIIEINKLDRDIYEKSIKAFVSWIRYYNEHQANFIFNLKKLDLGKIARSFGLFRLPKMPELSKVKVDFEPVEVDTQKISYLDKNREKKRLEQLKEIKEVKSLKRKSVSWSNQKQLKEKRLDRKEKKEKRKIGIAKAKEASKNSIMEDWEEMQTEARKLKKPCKKGSSDDEL